MTTVYKILNLLFHGLHFFVIGFTLFGWAYKPMRLANFILIVLTFGSWFILGRWLGYGYCPVTDFQWRIRKQLGKTDIPDSYIKLWIDRIAGRDLDSKKVYRLVLVAALIAALISLALNLKTFF